LNAVGAVTVSPDRAPGAKHVAAIRERIMALGAVCVFSEPAFEPKLMRTLVDGTQARTGVLDPEGTALPAGPELYFTLMRNLAENLAGCLGAQ
jgi:zinc transport system substrate-binding protein